jgi:hypothetical protein
MSVHARCRLQTTIYTALGLRWFILLSGGNFAKSLQFLVGPDWILYRPGILKEEPIKVRIFHFSVNMCRALDLSF